MTWSVSADPVDFDEAIAWFKKRVAVSKSDYRRMSAAAKRKAFTVANLAQLDLVHHAWKAIDDAVKKGTSLDDFKKSIGDDLKKAWGSKVADPPWRLETIFRTNVQMAYGAGRFKQATHPDVLGDRPVWMFDAILDGRTSSICKACDGTKRPANDAWWQTHTPPLHHNCRSSFIALTVAQAGKVTTSPPDQEPDGGFGVTPSDDEWEPDTKDYPKQLSFVFDAKQKLAPPPPPAPKFTDSVHVKAVETKGVAAKQVRELFAGVTDSTLLDLLEKHPVEKLSLSRSAGRGAAGWYDTRSGQIRVAMVRQSFTFGKPLMPGVSRTISSTALTQEEARRRTLIHEIGHHIHHTGKDGAIDALVLKAFRTTKTPITKYAGTNYKEYLAESFAAYFVDRNALRQFDPVGFKMVEDVLTARGVTP